MNDSVFNRHLEILEESNKKLSEKVQSILIDLQYYVKKEDKISPGIACKVAYDMNGLITRGMSMDESDIPEIGIDKIKGLRSLLNDKLGKNDMECINKRFDSMTFSKGSPIAVGTKIGYDKNGFVVTSDSLNINDIPDIPMNKITGMSEIIHDIEEELKQKSEFRHPKISAGTASKVTWDENGHVINGSDLTMDDIPISLVNKMNAIESKLPQYVTSSSISHLTEQISKKLTAPDSKMKSGTYTKLTVNCDGLIIDASNITMKDLPKIKINDIEDLKNELNKKADQSSIIEINNSISSIMSSYKGSSSRNNSALEKKADKEEVSELKTNIESMQAVIDKLSSIPSADVIMEQLKQIESELRILFDRVIVLENKI